MKWRPFFDTILQKFETRYLQSHRLLDVLLKKTIPSAEDIYVLRNHVPNNPVALGYFFSKLESAFWLEPLKNAGYFNYLPDIDRDDEKGTIGYPLWPESDYLLRMVGVEPEKVLQIMIQIPETDN